MLSMSGDGKSVGCKGCLDLRVVEVNDGAIIFKHVDFLNARDIVDCEFLK